MNDPLESQEVMMASLYLDTEVNVDEGMDEATVRARDEAEVRALEEAGYRSIFDIARHHQNVFLKSFTYLEPARARELHSSACRRVATLLSLYRAYQSRGEPAMQGIPKLGINPRPDALADAVQRSLGGSPDFSDLFPERSKDGYAEAASIQSLFSPGRYLTELYKMARGLHPIGSQLNIDQRRPDIAALTLSEWNMTREVSTLDILTHVLRQGIERHASTTMAALETTYYPMTLPYHDNLVQIRSTLSAQDSSLQQVWAVLSDQQAGAFAPVVYQVPTDPAANIATPSPAAREELKLAPATYSLLAGAPATAADIKRDYNLPSEDIARELRTVEVFTDRIGLSFNELVGLTGQLDPEAAAGYEARGRYYRVRGTEPVPVTEYGQTYIATRSSQPDPLLIVGGNLDYALIGSTHEASYPYQGRTITSTLTITNIFFNPSDNSWSGAWFSAAGIPADMQTFVCLYNNAGTVTVNQTFPPGPFTTHAYAEIAFAGAHWSPTGVGPTGPFTPRIRVWHEDPSLQLRLTSVNGVPLADRTERLVRLQRQVGLEFHELDWLIKQANLAFSPERADGLLLDQPVLEAVAEFVRLREAYSLSSEEFACFIGAVNVYAPANKPSLYEKLFTSPTERVTVPLNATVNFDPEVPSDHQSIIAGALEISEDELFVLAQIAFGPLPTAVVMDEGRYGQLYRLAMIPKMLGIDFAQARRLWQMLDSNRDMAAIVGGPATLETLAILRQTETVLLWLAAHKLSVEESFQLVTNLYSQSVTPELFNYAYAIFTSLSSDASAVSYRAGEPLDDSLRQKLYTLTASPFKVKPNVMSRLIQWNDQHFVSSTPAPDGTRLPYGLGDFWADIDTFFSSGPAQMDKLSGVPDVARYSQAMAQFALIALWANLTEQDLTLIVNTPQWFTGTTPTPDHSLRELLYIARLKQWQQRVVVPEAEAMSYFRFANTNDTTTADATAMLTYLHGWDLETTRAMNGFLVAQRIYADFPRTFVEVTRLEAWMHVGQRSTVGAATVDALYRMSLDTPDAEASPLIRQTAEQVAANLKNTSQLQETRRNPLVDYYIAYCVPDTHIDGSAPLSTRIRNANDLYEYLLIDTQITSAVTTSWVGEAISSLQLYISRCLGGYDPDVDNAPNSTMVAESRPGGFLYDWPDYNQIYSTWAGKERLQYYPSVYLNPSLRYNKTTLFEALESTLDQGKISEQRVNTAFQQYALGFEVLANLKTISGYQAGVDYYRNTKDTFYYVGRSQNAPPHTYYWRSCNMGVRNDQDELTAGAWSQWQEIKAPTAGALDDLVQPCWYNDRLYLCWISREEKGATGGGSAATPVYEYFSNIWCLPKDSVWIAYKKEALPVKPASFELVYCLSTGELYLWWSETRTVRDYWSNAIDFVCGDQYVKPDPVSVGQKYYFNKTEHCIVRDFKENADLKIQFILDSGQSALKFAAYGNAGIEVSSGSTTIPNLATLGFDIKNVIYMKFDLSNGETVVMYVSLVPEHCFIIDRDDWLKHVQPNVSRKKIVYLCTHAGPYFSRLLESEGISGLLSYGTQTALIEHGGTEPIDFDGAYGLYFWELFFHCSFLIADRYLTEQNYPQSQLWYQYIFNPAGYRNTEGELETIDDAERYWNVVPLQQDATWNVAIPPTVDPDAIAMNDPMHYKVAIFLNSVNSLIEQGDNAYRMLQRDYLVQAKMYYLQAAQMLGPRPPIDYRARWPNPSVAEEANAIAVVDFDNPDARAPTPLTQLLSAYLYEQNGDFLPPYNADLLAYWDKLEVRFYNLRHHLTLDGQPIALPLYAQPVDPRELQRRFGAGNGPGGNSVNAPVLVSQYRFPVLLDRAKDAVKGVMRLGRELLKAIESRDNEDVNFLLRTQRQRVLQLTNDMESTQIASLQDELTASKKTLEGAQKRVSHYASLYDNWISQSEQRAMNSRTLAGAYQVMSQPFTMAEAGVDMVPNIFGLAVGGAKFGALLGALSATIELVSSSLIISADRLDISEQYRRRREDWQIERDNATSEVAELEATIQAQTLQVAMARKQVALTKQELADEIAVHNLFDAAFTGPALYNWMCGRLSAIYYQHYSAALSLCLGCKATLAREIGPGRASHLFTAPMWNDLYQGLLAGEGLLLELQQLENTYLKDDRRGLEIVRPVQLDKLIQEADATTSLAAMVQAALVGNPTPVTGGVEVSMLENSKLVIKLSLATLGLDTVCGSNDKTGRLKNISVTLSPLVGPNQELEATLGLGGTYVALSHGVEDAGVFAVDYDDVRYLPFEGDPTSGTLVLTFFQVGERDAQRSLVEQLTDVTYQIRYTLKEY